MKKTILTSLLCAVLLPLGAGAAIPKDYYAAANGLKGAELMTAIGKIIKDSQSFQYAASTTYTNLRDTFKETDYITYEGNDTVYWLDRYSSELWPLTKSFADCGFQREHSLPKSWWKDTSLGTSDNSNLMYTRAYCDLHHLFPANGSANNAKSNWPLGEVDTSVNVQFDNGVTRVGVPVSGLIYGIDADRIAAITKVFEPADQWKGDFARAYMYVVTCYGSELATHWNEDYLWMTERNTYPVFTSWAQALVGKWHRADGVSAKEVTRNNDVYGIQGNRNPYIDFPNLYEYVWGDSVDVPFNIYTTARSEAWAGESEGETVTIYSNTFLGDDGGCTVTNLIDNGFDVWTNTASYGWKASGYYKSTNYACRSELVLPAIDLTGYQNITLTFDHALNYCTDNSQLQVSVRYGTNNVVLNDITWPSGSSWTFVGSGDIDLSTFAGKTVNIVFTYVSTTDEASTWEIKNLKVVGKTTVDAPVIEADNTDAPVEYYTVDGRRLSNVEGYKGVVIRRQGTVTQKMLIR